MEEKKNIPPQASRVGAVIIFFILLFVFAKWGPAINFSTTTQTKGEPLVVSGEGKVYTAPDIARITLGITDSGVSLKTVQESVNKKSQTLTNAIKNLGVDEKDIKTTSYNLYPQYDYLTSTTNRIKGYQVSTSYEITIRDVDNINDIIAAATLNGANMEGSVSFDLSDSVKKEKLNEARKIAANEAKEKAEGLAKSAGLTLGKMINISENQISDIPRPLYATNAAGAIEDKEATLPSIEAGQTEISVTVNLSYEIR